MLREAGLTKLIKFGGWPFNEVNELAAPAVHDPSVSQEPGWISPLPSLGVLTDFAFSQLSTCTERADP